MFNRETVFILGAGASWHYGYPTGEELVRRVIETAEKLARFFDGATTRKAWNAVPRFVHTGHLDRGSAKTMNQPWLDAKAKCEGLAKRLQRVNPLVIDYFLGYNPTLQDVGKLLICWVIMACEEKYLEKHANPNRRLILESSPFTRERESAVDLDITKFKDDWYRFVLHKLVTGCKTSSDLLRNNVHFITFNYDVSLEYALHHGLTSIDRFNDNDIAEFMKEPRITHCYGKVRDTIDPPKLPVTFEAFFHPMKTPQRDVYTLDKYDGDRRDLLDEVLEASSRLETIDPKGENENSTVASMMRNAGQYISDAEVVYILGYGFDEINTKGIGLTAGLQPLREKRVMFTNFEDINRVNKKAGRAITGSVSGFLPGMSPLQGFPPRGYVEKSVRNVYEALGLDFDELEDDINA